MTATLEQPAAPSIDGEEALKRIDSYLGIDERFQFEGLDREFAFYTKRLGVSGLYLADATHNAVKTFKLRGALNKMAKEQEAGESAAWLDSRGNHLLAGVEAGRILNMPVAGYVPINTSRQKINRARSLQPDTSMFRLHVEGKTLEESRELGRQHAHGVYVPPFDDADVVSGNGTIAHDLLEKARLTGVTIDHVVMKVGGGGGVTGIASELARLDPHVTVHAIESQGNNSLSQSLAVGRFVDMASPNLRYGGSAVKRTGEIALRYFQFATNVRLWEVSDSEVEHLADEYLDERAYRQLDHDPLEPTSLAAVAALEKIVKEYPGETAAVVGTGRNAPVEDLWRA